MDTPAAPRTRNRPGRALILAAIRNAAIVEFNQHGFKGASTQGIAQRAGLTKPQLHYYIAGKDELYQQLLREVLAGWSNVFVVQGHEDDPRAVLIRYIREKVDYSLDNPMLSRLFTRELLDGGPNLGSYWPVAIASTQAKIDLIERWVAEKRLRPLDARLLLMHIWAMTQHYADYALQVRQMLGSTTADVAALTGASSDVLVDVESDAKDDAPIDSDADDAAQVHSPAPLPRERIVREITDLVLLGCGLAPL